MNVMVTGSKGYLGSHVFSILRRNGHNVIGMSGRDDSDWCACALDEQVNCVIHLGWYSSAGDAHPHIQRNCLEQTIRLMKSVSVRNQPTPWFVFASSASVHGSHQDKVFTEQDPARPGCEYTRCKVEAEKYAFNLLRYRHTTLRFGSLMGLGARNRRTKTDLVVNALASDAYATGVCRVWSPEAWKPVIHVRDAAQVVVRAAEREWRGTFDAVAGNYRARDIAELVRLQTGCAVEVMPSPPGPVRSCRVDSAKLRARMGSYLFRAVTEAVAEFEGFVPSPQDKNVPWF